MNKEEAIKMLEWFNKWRRADEVMEMPNPREVGKAIDFAIKYLKDE